MLFDFFESLFSDQLTDGTSGSASHYSESEFPDSVWHTGHLSR